ncbi:hypothetical protein PY365_25850 [Roseiarcaceae bacterium H3SJ34-1]|uniref:hypothetical protein n=1 Tax=Terripilifer ovatus TaxID=3032367 RepID=UPI003AB97111|nr:hypothetical protein [Roseiarcaceae bacterium H3SJ34-1]
MAPIIAPQPATYGSMFSIIVLTQSDNVHASPSSEAVARTLAALVPGAISGVIRDVILASMEKSTDIEHIADHAGCELVTAGTWIGTVRLALQKAREPKIFTLQAGFAPESGFYEELSDLGWSASLKASRLLERPETTLQRFLPFLAPVAGLAAAKDRLVNADGPDFRSWAGQLGRMDTMRTRARRVDSVF